VTDSDKLIVMADDISPKPEAAPPAAAPQQTAASKDPSGD